MLMSSVAEGEGVAVGDGLGAWPTPAEQDERAVGLRRASTAEDTH
jgi:hypothetical protein